MECVLLALLLGAAGPAAAQTQPLVEQARQAARADRNAEAAGLFERAVREDPARRREVLRELADQLTYSGRAAEAVPLYREVLGWEAEPRARRWTRLGLALALSWTDRLRDAQREYESLVAEDPGDVDARLGRARVLAWRDRLGDARGEYLRILAAAPGAFEARRELARVQWWRGRPRDAQRRLAGLLREHPDDTDIQLLLAEVRGSLGRPDLARAAVRDVLGRDPGHEGARTLGAALALGNRPVGRVQRYASEQSDRLDIRTTAVEQRFRPNAGRSEAGLRYELQDYAPEQGGGGVRIHRPALFGRHRVSDALEVNAAVQGELIAAARDRSEVSYDAWATLWPADVVRLDLSARRAVFDNLRSLELGITGTYAGLSLDLTPAEKTRLTARGTLGRLSDGNRQRWGQLEAEHRVLDHPRTLVGARLTAIDFSRSTGNGYFEPQDFRAAVATLRIHDSLWSRLWWDVEGSYGREDTRTAGQKPLWSAGARASYRIGRRTEVDLRYLYFSSTEGSSGGFARGSLRAGVSRAW